MTSEEKYKCIFCGASTKEMHHIMPTGVRKMMGWKGKRQNAISRFKVPICKKHHIILHDLLKPMETVIRCLRFPPLTFDIVMDLETIMLKYTEVKEDEREEEEET